MRRSHKFLKNLSFGFVSRGWQIVLILSTTPYIVNKLGTDSYGALSIILTMVGYFNLADFGMGNTVVKYLSEYLARKDYEIVKKLVRTSLLYYGAVGLAAALLIAVLSPVLVSKVLIIPAGLRQTALTAFYVTAITFFFNMISTLFTSVLKGYQRFELLALRDMGIYTLSTVLTVVLLFFGYGLIEIVVLNLFTSMISVALFYIAIKSLLGKIKIRPQWDKETFGILFHFSKWKFIGGVSSKIAYTVDKVIISSILGVSQLTFYIVPLNLAQYVGMKLIGTINHVIYPLMSESAAIDNSRNQKELYFRSLKWIFIILSPAVLYLIVFGDKFLYYWIGEEFSKKGTLVLWILCISYLSGALVYNDVSYIEAKGNSMLPSLTALASASIMTGLNLLLLPFLGILGAAIAFAVAAFSTGIYIKHKTLYGMLDSGWLEFFKAVIFRPLSALTTAFIILLPMRLMGHNKMYYFSMVPVSGLIILISFYFFRCFDYRDKEIIKSFLYKIKSNMQLSQLG